MISSTSITSTSGVVLMVLFSASSSPLGEPTFIAKDDLDAAEWNTAALGPTKRALARDLYARLRERYAPQGLVHFGQGKWYPGEPLPRWALGLIWRTDGEPMWSHDALIAKTDRAGNATVATAQAFALRLAAQLQLPAKPDFPRRPSRPQASLITKERRFTRCSPRECPRRSSCSASCSTPMRGSSAPRC
jgi:uncharacterized protein (DUF2126 family)